MPTGMPEVPHITKVADSVAQGVKGAAEAGVNVATDLSDGVAKLALGLAHGATRAVSDAVSLVESEVSTGKIAVTSVIGRVRAGVDRAHSEVDRGFGHEVIEKFRKEVEKVVDDITG